MVISGVIKETDQLANSPSGNTRWFVQLEDGRGFKTAPDAQVAFGINNDEYNGGSTVFLTLDARSEIVGVKTTDGRHFSGRTE